MPDITTPAAHEVCKDDNDGALVHVPDADDADPDAHNCCIGAEAELLTGGKVVSGKVRQRKREADGSLKGAAHPNPILDA